MRVGRAARAARMEGRVNIDELRELLQILDERGVGEFELEEGGRKLRIRKSAGLSATVSATPTAQPPAAPAPLVAASPAPVPAPAEAAPTPSGAEAGLSVMTSPIVGTFYRAADPNSPAFVNVGDRVKLGQVLCIIEAMKLMNEIEAESAGEVVKIHPENGQPVQYGDALFTIRAER